MFNTTIIEKGRTEYVPYEKTVIEKKAPTDESLRLLGEYKETALKDTMLLFTVKNTLVDAAFRYTQSTETLERGAVVTFKVNNKTITKILKIDDSLALAASQIEITNYLLEEWRKIVTGVVLEITSPAMIGVVLQNISK